MMLPNEVRPGQSIGAKHYNDLLRFCKSLRLRGGPGARVTHGSGGTTIAVKLQQTVAGSGGGAASPEPFDVAISDGSDVDHFTATVRPGTLNGLIPTNILTTPDLLLATPYYVVLSAVVSDGAITSCTLSFPTATPSGMPTAEGIPPLAFDFLLGMIIDGVWYRTIGTGSLFASSYEVFRVSKTAPDPGTLPYDIWYSWALTTA